MLKLFKGSQPALIIIIPLLTGLIWLKSFLQPTEFELTYDLYEMPLWDILNTFLGNNVIIRKISAIILLIVNALWLSRINTKFILVKARTYLPTLFYGFICSSFLPLQDLNPALIAVTLFIQAVNLMFESYKEEKLSYKYFESALLISCASLFYAPAALFMVIVWIGLSILKTPRWRDWIFTIIGFIFPYIFILTILYFTDTDIPGYFSNFIVNFKITRGFDYLGSVEIIYFSFLLLLILVASGTMIGVYQGLKIYARIYYRVFFWIFLFTMGIFFGLYNRSFELIYFSALPVSYLLTFYFYSIRSRLIGEILFSIFIGLIIVVEVMG